MSAHEQFKFRLFVASDAPNSTEARSNLKFFCNTYLPDQHEIEVVDVLQEPRRGIAEGIMLTPTLIKLAPMPVRRIVGTLSNTQILRDALGIAQRPT